jgi:hypothetical protein
VKTAKELVREIGLAVQPGIMETSLTVRFSDKVAELMNTDPNVDWGDVDQGPGEFRRVVKFLSEETD